MADGGARKGSKPAVRPRTLAGSAAAATLELTLDDLLHQPLPGNLPAEMFTGPGLLALADLLPVMTAYVDRDARYRFINKPLAEWLGQSAARDDRPDHGRGAGRARPSPRASRCSRRALAASGSSSRRASTIRRAGRSRRRPNMCRGPIPRPARSTGVVMRGHRRHRAAGRRARAAARARRGSGGSPIRRRR